SPNRLGSDTALPKNSRRWADRLEAPIVQYPQSASHCLRLLRFPNAKTNANCNAIYCLGTHVGEQAPAINRSPASLGLPPVCPYRSMRDCWYTKCAQSRLYRSRPGAIHGSLPPHWAKSDADSPFESHSRIYVGLPLTAPLLWGCDYMAFPNTRACRPVKPKLQPEHANDLERLRPANPNLYLPKPS